MKSVDRDSWVDGFRYAMARECPPALPRKEVERIFNVYFGVEDDPRNPHGYSLAFQHKSGEPCIVCDRVRL